MPDFDQAETVARAWVQSYSRGNLELDPATVMVRPYGWVFGFRARQPVTGGWIGVLCDRVNGDLLAIGTGHLCVEAFLVGYEAAIPPARLRMQPDFPADRVHYRGGFGIVDADKPIDPARFPEPLRSLHLSSS
jgi:hypothetical protein